MTAWRKLAETASQYLTKGSKVLVVGELEAPTTYTDRDGQVRVSLDVTASTIRFLSTRGESDGAEASASSHCPSDEDIPF